MSPSSAAAFCSQWLLFALCIVVLVTQLYASPQAGKASWVYTDSNGNLQYKTTPGGDKILDFSSVGYNSGLSPIPSGMVANKVTLKPLGGSNDDTAQIQKALNQVAAMPVDSNGFRGAVLLGPGTYNLKDSLTLSGSGVVLRGSGSGSSGTELLAWGNPRQFIVMTGAGKPQLSSQTWAVTGCPTSNYYIPSGEDQWNVQDSSGLEVGDQIMIVSTITAKFISALGMDKLVRDGKPQVWIPAGTKVMTDRVVKSISGNTITLDAPFPESVNATLFDTHADVPHIAKYTWLTRLENSGIENLRAVVQAPVFNPAGGLAWQFINVENAVNCWVNNLFVQDFGNGVVNTLATTKWITVSNIYAKFTITGTRDPYPGDFSMCGTQILLTNVTDVGCSFNFPLLTPALCRGPIVFHNIYIDPQGRDHVNNQPHMRWSTGLLYDNVTLVASPSDSQGGNSGLINRYTAGSGHGWAVGWSLFWNLNSKTVTAENPAPVALNWIIGGTGQNVQNKDHPNGLDGTYDSQGTPVNNPVSLYQTQVQQRS